MSNFKRVTQHPLTKEWEVAMWLDDHFGKHKYGVKFAKDDVIYREEAVPDLKTLWRHDVMEAFVRTRGMGLHDLAGFLNTVQEVYKERWERDPEGGEGAVNWYRGLTRQPDEYAVESGIPVLPAGRGGFRSIYPFGEMEVGDSFAFPINNYKRVSVSAAGYAKKYEPMHFVLRKISETEARCWRIR